MEYLKMEYLLNIVYTDNSTAIYGVYKTKYQAQKRGDYLKNKKDTMVASFTVIVLSHDAWPDKTS